MPYAQTRLLEAMDIRKKLSASFGYLRREGQTTKDLIGDRTWGGKADTKWRRNRLTPGEGL
jgi:hypothetical protein